MLMFTGFAGTTEYLAVGALPYKYLLWFGSIGALGGQVGQRVVRRLVERTGRPSYVVFLLGGVIALAVLCMTGIGIARLAGSISRHEPIGAFHADLLLCHATDGTQQATTSAAES